MSQPWNDRVEAYVERLRQITTSIAETLDDTRVNTLAPDSEELNAQASKLAASIRSLETMVDEREALLHAEDAPPTGITLTEKLLATRRIDDARLARQCREVSGELEATHQRAVSLFVCQFHLANFGKELLQLLSGSLEGATYGDGPSRTGQGGGLFNEAA